MLDSIIIEGDMIGLWVNVPENQPDVARLFPPDNFIGGALLLELLLGELSHAGQAPKSLGATGPLNDWLMILTVPQIPRALRVIKAALQRINLLFASHLAWSDSRELIWRDYHQPPGALPFNQLHGPVSKRLLKQGESALVAAQQK